MSSYNKVILVGRLTVDPELKYTTNGKAKVSFQLAVDRPTSTKETDFFSITAWEKLAETCGRFLNKGKLVLIEGRLQNYEFQGNDGVQKKGMQIVASDMRMLGSKSEGGGQGEPRQMPQPAAAGVGAARPSAPASDPGVDDLGMDDIPF